MTNIPIPLSDIIVSGPLLPKIPYASGCTLHLRQSFSQQNDAKNSRYKSAERNSTMTKAHSLFSMEEQMVINLEYYLVQIQVRGKGGKRKRKPGFEVPQYFLEKNLIVLKLHIASHALSTKLHIYLNTRIVKHVNPTFSLRREILFPCLLFHTTYSLKLRTSLD